MKTPDQEFLGVWSFIGALIKQIWMTTTFFTVLSAVVTIVNRYFNNVLSVESAPIALLGTLVSFMVTVKVNNDQSTWKNGRAEWSNIAANTRQLATLIWHNAQVTDQVKPGEASDPANPSSQDLKNICLDLLRVFAVATKYGIEGQGHFARDDPAILGVNATLMPTEKPRILRLSIPDSGHQLDESPNEIPRDILTSLSACIATLTTTSSLPPSLLPTIQTSLFSLQTPLSALTRTSTSEPPQTALLQTRLSVYAYLFFLPFQLNGQLGWWTIPAEGVVALVYLGFVAVGVDIGRPFQKGLTRLDVGGLVEDLKRQIDEIAQTQGDRDNIRSLARPRVLEASRNSSQAIVPSLHHGVDSLIDLESQAVPGATPSRVS